MLHPEYRHSRVLGTSSTSSVSSASELYSTTTQMWSAESKKMLEGKYPLLHEAMALDLVLGPGEVLYLPSFWTHMVVSLADSIQVYHICV